MATATAPAIPREIVEDRIAGFVTLTNGDPAPPLMDLWAAIRAILEAAVRTDDYTGTLVDELGDHVLARIVDAVSTGEVTTGTES